MRAALVASALAAACGGGASSTSTPPSPSPSPSPTPSPSPSPTTDEAPLDSPLPQNPPVGADGTPPVSIPLGILEPLRTSGQPYPPADIPPGRAVIKLCLDRDGAPTAARVMRSSGQRDRDSQLLHFVAAWHFRSFAVNGEPVDVCTIVTFAHRAPPATP